MIYALIHYPPETPGLISAALAEKGLPVQEVHLHENQALPSSVDEVDRLIVMGGPMGVEDVKDYPFLAPELKLVEACLKKKKPVLGICLGSQLIAKALGARVYPNAHKEVGWYPIYKTTDAAGDSFFGALPHELKVLHWHGDTFDLPKGSTHLAYSDRCMHQAFRWGENVVGLQFHMEVTPPMVQQWVHSPQGQKDMEGANEDGQKILKETDAAYKNLLPHTKSFLASYFHV